MKRCHHAEHGNVSKYLQNLRYSKGDFNKVNSLQGFANDILVVLMEKEKNVKTSWFQGVIIIFWWSKCQLSNVIMTLSFDWSFFCSKLPQLHWTWTCAQIFYQLYVHLPVQCQHNNARRSFFLTLMCWIYTGKFLQRRT